MKVIWNNVNGVHTKLEKDKVIQLLKEYYIFCLSEVKTSLLVAFPGYVAFHSKVRERGDLGGTVVFVRSTQSHLVVVIDVDTVHQVWLQFKNIPGTMCGFWHVPPAESPYYSHSSFLPDRRNCTIILSMDHIIIGDLNGKFGGSERELFTNVRNNAIDTLSYPVNYDVRTASDNAEMLLALCKERKLVIVNNLMKTEKHYVQKKRYMDLRN